ncbi:MAG: hypothetical protein KIS68_01600 [Bauldia sp.]|nr:hypothetical protein [Bauldia sp.]
MLATLLAALLVPQFAAAAPLSQSLIALVPFATAPFPYDGIVPETGEPFLDVVRGGRRGHTAPRGGVYWEDETYADSRGLVFIPAGFDPARPAVVVAFFHGNNATLESDVLRRQNVAGQLQGSGLNAVLVAPQFAIDALDSSAGRFWQPGAFAAWLAEASDHLAVLLGNRALAAGFDRLPVVLVAYSGGYLPAAYALTGGGADGRLCGAILLDAVYGEVSLFADWIARKRSAFFFSAYSASAAAGNVALIEMLAARGIPTTRGNARDPIVPGGTAFLGVSASHEDFLTRAWRPNPLQALFAGIATGRSCG